MKDAMEVCTELSVDIENVEDAAGIPIEQIPHYYCEFYEIWEPQCEDCPRRKTKKTNKRKDDDNDCFAG